MDDTTRALAKHGKVQLPRKLLKEHIRKAALHLSNLSSFGGVPFDELGQWPSFLLASLFLALKALTFALLLYFTVISLTSKMFLSLSGDQKGADCKPVPQPVVGVFEGDYQGYWQGSPQFNVNQSLFLIKFTGKGVTNAQYQTVMKGFWSRLRQLGGLSRINTGRWAYMTWSSLNFVDAKTGLAFFSNVDSAIVFDASVQSAFIASSKGVCTGSRVGQLSGYYDLTLAQTVLRFPVSWNATANSVTVSACPNDITIRLLRNVSKFDSTQLKLGYIDYGFDVRMAALVVSLNSGILTLEGLVRKEDVATRKFGLIGYIDTQFTNPPQQRPIYCLEKQRTFEVYGVRLTQKQIAGPEVCFIVSSFRFSNLIFFYPSGLQATFSSPRKDIRSGSTWLLKGHPRKKFNIMKKCKCPGDALDPFCSQNIFHQAFIYDRYGRNERLVQMALKIQKARIIANSSSGSFFTERAMFYSHAISKNPWLANISLQSWTDASTGILYDYSYAKGQSLNQLLAEEFKEICNNDCAMYFFETYSYTARTSISTPMNKYGVTLRDISPNASTIVRFQTVGLNLTTTMCVDTFSQPVAMARLSETPPVSLEAPYFECKTTILGALTQSTGNAIATSGVSLVFAWSAMGLLFKLVMKMRRKKEGNILLTVATKKELEAAQTQMRSELLFEGFAHLRNSLPASYVAKLESARCLFYNLRPNEKLSAEESDGLLVCGQEISSRLLHAKSLKEGDGAVDSNSNLNQHRTRRITISLPSADASPSRKSFVAGESRSSLRLSAHPMDVVLQSLQPPNRASLRGGNVRRSLAGIHQL